MNSNLAPDLTGFVVAFLVLDVLALLALAGVVADVVIGYFRRHRAIRHGLSERVLPYYRRVASGQ